jgi:hypothetical protein
MKTELLYLVYVTVLTGLLWVPYIFDRIAKWGLVSAVGYPDSPAGAVPVGAAADEGAPQRRGEPRRVRCAGPRGPCPHTFAIPWVRTLAFAVGFFAQAVIAWQIVVR